MNRISCISHEVVSCISDDPIRYIYHAVKTRDNEQLSFAYSALTGLGVKSSLVRDFIFHVRTATNPCIEFKSDNTIKCLINLKYALRDAIAEALDN